MKFVADENLEQQIVDSLRKANHEVVFIAESNPSIDDTEVLEMASQSQAIVITNDKDFGELVFRKRKNNHGVILLRLHGLSNDEKAKVTMNCIKQHEKEISNGYTVITKEAIRIRKLNVIKS